MGTNRLVLRSDLPSPEFSPRTQAFRMRTRCATASISRQRMPSSSDCLTPVVPAARITRRRTGPSESRSTTTSGITAITASSSRGVRNCRSGLASVARRRRGRAASVTGLACAHPFLTASANTECRNVIVFRTVFGAKPFASSARASRSMSSVLTASTRRLPSPGEIWTLCIDSQFWRYDSRAPSMTSRSRKVSAASSTVRGRSSRVGAGRTLTTSSRRRRTRSAARRESPSCSPRSRTLPRRGFT
jgi:hypothetical protein